MSYCVNCGVELHPSAKGCPLCGAPVVNPYSLADDRSPTPYPQRRTDVGPALRRELALLLTAMLTSVSVCCALLNIVLLPSKWWSSYFIGACALLWVVLVPPLLLRRLNITLKLAFDACATALYIYLIAFVTGGGEWYFELALPILTIGAVIVLVLSLILRGGGRSMLTTAVLVIGSIGLFAVGVDLFLDWYLSSVWILSWSLVVGIICIALITPLLVVRYNPRLREEVRRRFHM
jgi:hypothetical protein